MNRDMYSAVIFNEEYAQLFQHVLYFGLCVQILPDKFAIYDRKNMHHELFTYHGPITVQALREANMYFSETYNHAAHSDSKHK